MDWNKKYLNFLTLKSIIGLILGAIGGFAYYRLVGCSTGSCPIKSNPWLMTLFGTVMGYLIGDMFNKNEPKNNQE